MSVAMESIFDEPLAKTPSPVRRIGSPSTNTFDDMDDEDEDGISRPSKRVRHKLFLDDLDDPGSPQKASSSNNSQNADGRRQSAAPEGVDALFEDLDEMEKEMTSSKPFDLDAMRREANARAMKEVSSSQISARYAVQSSSPPREGLSEQRSSMGTIGAKGKSGEKEKRPIVKLDETRLLGKDGLPALVQQSKHFKPKGKGHEVQDLNRLFAVYQFWAHKMYPKLQFGDVVNRVEKLCHQKRLHIALSVWRDEANGTINGFKPEDQDMNSDKSDESGDEGNAQGAEKGSPSSRAPSSSRASSPAPGPPISRPPSSASNNDDFNMSDEFDFDAMMALEEEIRAAPVRSDAGGSSSRPSTLSMNQVKARKGPAQSDEMDFSVTEDEEALFNDMFGDDPSIFYDMPRASASGPIAKANASASGSGSATLSESRPAGEVDPPNAATQSRAGSEPEDEWAILDELEAEQLADARRASDEGGAGTGSGNIEVASSTQLGQTSGSVGETAPRIKSSSVPDGTSTSTLTPPVPSGPSESSPNRVEPGGTSTTEYGDDDWDDMYVDI